MSFWSWANKFGKYVAEGASQVADFVADLDIPVVSTAANAVGNAISGFSEVAAEEQAQKQQQKQFEAQLQTQEDIANANLEYQKEHNERIFEREDNALQRGVADAQAAGLSPLAATPARSGGSAVVPTMQDYSASAGLAARGLNPAAAVMQGLQARGVIAQIQKTQAETQKTVSDTLATKFGKALDVVRLQFDIMKETNVNKRFAATLAYQYKEMSQKVKNIILEGAIALARLNAEIDARAAESEAQRDWQTSEREASQGFQEGTRRAQNVFTSSERAKDRANAIVMSEMGQRFRMELSKYEYQKMIDFQKWMKDNPNWFQIYGNLMQNFSLDLNLGDIGAFGGKGSWSSGAGLPALR